MTIKILSTGIYTLENRGNLLRDKTTGRIKPINSFLATEFMKEVIEEIGLFNNCTFKNNTSENNINERG